MNHEVQHLQEEVKILQHRIVELEAQAFRRQQSEQILRTIVEGTAAATSGDFLQLLVQKLAAALQVRYAFITECAGPKPADPTSKFRTLAFWKGQNFGDNFEYEVTGTPCEYVAHSKSCCYYPDNIQTLFPEDQDLEALNAESYIGIPLLDSSGYVMGHLAALDDKPMTDRLYLESIMKIFTARAAAEMERKQAEETLRDSSMQLAQALQDLQRTQLQLLQSEKMSALGQLVAGIAHEINNPVNFIYGNLEPAQKYIRDLLEVLALYQTHFPNGPAELQSRIEAGELEFIQEDAPKLLASMQAGAERIREIVRSLRLFSALDEAEVKAVNLHQGLESTLMLLEHRLKATDQRPEITIVKEYGDLSLVECYPGPLNQVFMNILMNAIDAIEEKQTQNAVTEPPSIRICTTGSSLEQVSIQIIDNGSGIDEATQKQLFNPFFTTKPIGKGIGMGLSISYQIITEKHRGTLHCTSVLGVGTELALKIPIHQSA